MTDLKAPNGIGFSPDERTLYVANADRARPIWMAYEVAPDGSLGHGREFADARGWVREGDGLPDGLKIDRRGNLFATGPGGVHVFAPDGTRLGRVETGIPTGNLNWGEDGTVLYITANHWILRLRTTTSGWRAETQVRIGFSAFGFGSVTLERHVKAPFSQAVRGGMRASHPWLLRSPDTALTTTRTNTTGPAMAPARWPRSTERRHRNRFAPAPARNRFRLEPSR